jgi:hypothetical protein
MRYFQPLGVNIRGLVFIELNNFTNSRMSLVSLIVTTLGGDGIAVIFIDFILSAFKLDGGI